MYIVVDFDGTCVTHDWPKMGKDIGSIPVLKALTNAGHQLILFTMRSEKGVRDGRFKSGLNDAVKWFKDNDIPLFGIQSNPTQFEWTDSPKAYGQLIIDDAALGCPLRYDKDFHERPFVDWVVVEKWLKESKIL